MHDARLHVPEGLKGPFGQLFKLSEEQLTTLTKVLSDASPTSSLRALARAVAPQAGLEESEAHELVGLLASLYRLRERLELTVDGLLEELRPAAQDKLDVAEQSWMRIRPRLQDLLSLDHSLGVSAKAVDVTTAHQHLLCSARLFTDIRPVFGQDVEPGPTALRVMHTLKIEYHEGDETREFFVALDSDQLRSVEKLLDRAKAKEETLKRLLGKTDATVLD